MSVTIGSLYGDHERLLDDLNLLPEESDEESADDEQVEEVVRGEPPTATPQSSPAVVPRNDSGLSRQYRHGQMGGIPWFEEMVEGSRLGRMLRARRGMGVSDDQSSAVEWEISEMHHGGPNYGTWTVSSSSTHVSGKRKEGEDTEVRETRSARRRTDS